MKEKEVEERQRKGLIVNEVEGDEKVEEKWECEENEEKKRYYVGRDSL